MRLDFCRRMRYIFHMAKQQTEEKVFSFMEKYKMIRPGDRLILGVSGGADSVCLLFLLLEYRKRVPFEIAVVHVNHGIRGTAAEEDAAYVEKLCREQNLTFRLESVDVRGFAAEEKCSEEDAGRRLRYKAFEKAVRELGGTKIGVAHNAEDRAETMLLHLFRGSGLKGMRGIEPVRAGIVRPVLCLERHEIEAYLRERNIPWRTDATNDGDDYTRNRIRHYLLPWAEREISGRVVSHMCRTADILSETEDYLRQQTCAALADCLSGSFRQDGDRAEIRVDRFLACHPVLQKRMLLSLAEELSPTGKDISAVHVEEVLSLFEKEGNRSVDLPFGIRFSRRYGKVVAGRRKEPQSGTLPRLSYKRILIGEEETIPEDLYARNQYTKCFDCDKIKETPVLRFRRTGDYLTITDGGGNMIRKSLKDYMIGEKIPREMRDCVPVLAEGSHVLWLVGYRISEYYKINGNTKCILQVKLKGELPGQ